MDTLTRLTHEHDDLRGHLSRLQSAAQIRSDEALLIALQESWAALTSELDSHIANEEEHIFTAIDETLGEALTSPFREEHIQIRALRDDVFAQSQRGIAPYEACLRLCDVVLEHQQREDLMLFPTARTVLPAAHIATPDDP